MAGSKSRNKGQRGEREFITILQGVIDAVFGEGVYELKRNLFQTREGGCDVSIPPELDFISVEIKRQETLSINSWWEQAQRQTEKWQQPILAYRQSRKPWKIIMMGLLPEHGTTKMGAWCRVEVSLESFLTWYENNLESIKRKGVL